MKVDPMEAGAIIERYHESVRAHQEAIEMVGQRKREMEDAKIDAENLIDAAHFKVPAGSQYPGPAISRRAWVKSRVDESKEVVSILDITDAARNGGSILSYRYAAQMLTSLVKAGEIDRAGHGLYCKKGAQAACEHYRKIRLFLEKNRKRMDQKEFAAITNQTQEYVVSMLESDGYQHAGDGIWVKDDDQG